MNKKVSATLAIAAATLATGSIAAGPAFAESPAPAPAPATVGTTLTSRSDLNWSLDGGQSGTDVMATTDYTYDTSGYYEKLHAVYHLDDGRTWTVDAVGHPAPSRPLLMNFTSGNAVLTTGTASTTYPISGGGFVVDPSTDKAVNVVIFDQFHGLHGEDV